MYYLFNVSSTNLFSCILLTITWLKELGVALTALL